MHVSIQYWRNLTGVNVQLKCKFSSQNLEKMWKIRELYSHIDITSKIVNGYF